MCYSIVFVGAVGFEPTISRLQTGHLNQTRLRPTVLNCLERVARIELAKSAWKADGLPLAYTRTVIQLFIRLYIYIVSDGSDILSPNEDSNPGPAVYKTAALRN
jgi:hypothetical protein